MSKNKLHIERLKKIRPFINFDYNINEIKKGNISEYDKKKIKDYYDEIKELTAHPHYVYRPRSNKRDKLAREYANQSGKKGFKTVILKSDKHGQKPKLIFKKDSLEIETENMRYSSALFDKNLLITDVNKAVDKAKAKLKGADYFTVMCGKHESFKKAGSRKTINKIVDQMQTRYKNTGEWLNGLYGYQAKNQASFDEYRNAQQAAKKQYQAIRKRDKSRLKTIDKIEFALETTSDSELRNDLNKRKNKLTKLLGK